MSEAVIPRLKSRRRRRRPLSPAGWMALAQVATALLSLTFSFVGLVSETSEVWRVICVLCACVNSVFIRNAWPILCREIRRMYD